MTQKSELTEVAEQESLTRPKAKEPPRLLIEEWLPAAAIGVECMRERSTGQQPPDKRLHVWWARKPLTASRAAVLGSLLPADFPRDVFEKLLGFWGTSEQIVAAQTYLEAARSGGMRVPNPHGQRAFRKTVSPDLIERAKAAASSVWGNELVRVLDPMAGGGSIPFEAARLGFETIANEYNPVACSILEATVDYPFRFGLQLAAKARKWGVELRKRFNSRVEKLFPPHGVVPAHCYIFARTIPCPDTGYQTPLVPDWHLLRPKSGSRVVAWPVVDKKRGTWKAEIRTLGRNADPPQPTYENGKGISLFTHSQIPADYIKAKAQQGQMRSHLYAVALKRGTKLWFEPPSDDDLEALDEAERELERLRPRWEHENIIPVEAIPIGDETGRPRVWGMLRWADLFSPRQLLCMGVLVEELRKLRQEIIQAEGKDLGEAVLHLLNLALDKLLDYNNTLNTWECTRAIVKHLFQRHDYSFKGTYAEMAPCNAGSGLEWALTNVLDAYEELTKLCRESDTSGVEISFGSATNLPQIPDGSITAVVVDPPYADNVQYSELADFFYVWLKRTQGHRRPDWFSTELCERDQEAVVNVSRHRDGGRRSTEEARQAAKAHYERLMFETFRECRRVLRDDGVLTVMFTHKKQEAWESLFESLIKAGFQITASWPIKTESEHSLHQARKNAAQSTVILVARKRRPGAARGYFDDEMRQEIRAKARATAERLKREGLNAVDQLVGAFGPAMEVYSRYDEVRLDTGHAVDVGQAIDEAAEAVTQWRIEQLAARGLEGVEPEGRFVLLCWDVLGAAEFRFNEAKLLGHAVGMDVDSLIRAGLVKKSGENILMVPAKERRRDRPLGRDQLIETAEDLSNARKRRHRADILKIHPNDEYFLTAIDACHALALRYLEGGGGKAGIGSAKALVRQQGWTKDSAVAKLMEALVKAAPKALRKEGGKNSPASRFPEFRAWHELLEPLFGIPAPDWTEPEPPQFELCLEAFESDAKDAEDWEEQEAEEDGE